MLKRIFLLLPLLGQVCSCGGEGGPTVKFRADNYQAEQLSLAWTDAAGEYQGARVPIVDGRGEWTADVPENTRITVYNLDKRNMIPAGEGIIPGPSISFYTGKGTVTVSFDADQWPLATFKGGRVSKDVDRYWKVMGPMEKSDFENVAKMIEAQTNGTEYDKSVREELGERMRQAKIDFMAANPDSPLSLDLYKSLKNGWKYDEQVSYFQSLGKALRESDEGVRIAGDLETMKTLMPGNPAPLFSKTDKDGNRVSLADYLGKHVLIDFWGTWCGPCRSSHPHLVELYEKYNPMGVEFINIALESGNGWRQKWLDVIEEDGLVWANIADNEYPEEGNIVEMYQISAFPTKYLIGPDGRIIGNSFDMDIDAKLAEIFGR